MPIDPTPPRRGVWPRRLARLGLAAATLALALGTGEAALRWRAARAGSPHDAKRARESLWMTANGMSADLSQGRVEIRGAMGDSRVMLHPYLGFDGASGLNQYETHLARAHSPEGARDFAVFMLGGSVASLVAVEARATLVELLSADPRLEGREVRVHVYSRGAFKQPQQVVMLTYLLNLGLEPDAVINIDGYNELTVNSAGYGESVHPVQPLLTYWGSVLASSSSLDAETAAVRERAVALAQSGRSACLRFNALGLDHSALATWVMDALMRRHRARLVELQDTYAHRLQRIANEHEGGPSRVLLGPRLPAGEDALAACVRSWTESSRMLRAICEARGVPYVHLLQPTLHDEGSKPLTEAERASGSLAEAGIAAVHAGYPLLRAAGRELAAEGLDFVDASGLFADVQETLYYDACHFNAPGTDMLAQEAARAVLQNLP